MNKYYLQTAELVDDTINGNLYYRLIYSNGIRKKVEIINFDLSNSLSIQID